MLSINVVKGIILFIVLFLLFLFIIHSSSVFDITQYVRFFLFSQTMVVFLEHSLLSILMLILFMIGECQRYRVLFFCYLFSVLLNAIQIMYGVMFKENIGSLFPIVYSMRTITICLFVFYCAENFTPPHLINKKNMFPAISLFSVSVFLCLSPSSGIFSEFHYLLMLTLCATSLFFILIGLTHILNKFIAFNTAISYMCVICYNYVTSYNMPLLFFGYIYEILFSFIMIVLINVKIFSICHERNKEAKNLQKILDTDALTGLYNKKFIYQSIAQCLSANKNFSVLFIDIDRFKKVNDSYGHEKGDEVIKKIASCLKYSVRTSDICSRFGGEEFIVLLEGIASDNAYLISERIRRRIDADSNSLIHVTISIGVYNYDGETISVNQIITNADEAMYEAKRAGRNCTVVYKEYGTPTM